MSRIRRKLVVDNSQHVLARRVVYYWGFCVLTISFLTFCSIALTENVTSSRELMQLLWRRCGLSMLASALVIPVVIMDCIRLSNRIIGPIFRLQRAMHGAATGMRVEPIQFRPDDFWADFADDFNAVLAQLSEEQSEPDPARTSQPPIREMVAS